MDLGEGGRCPNTTFYSHTYTLTKASLLLASAYNKIQTNFCYPFFLNTEQQALGQEHCWSSGQEKTNVVWIVFFIIKVITIVTVATVIQHCLNIKMQ